VIIGEAGVGEGYFTFWLSKRVGEAGKIYANDIDKRALNKLEDKCKEKNITNIQTVIGEIDDPLFPVDNLDFVVMMRAFHDFTKPVEWMKNVKKYLKPEAKLVIIDGDPEKLNSSRGHFLTEKQILDIMKKTDFDLEKIETFLARDNIYIFNLREK
jgi:ubiquinone/menaquinone biosynthesis C-methylase UbiE